MPRPIAIVSDGMWRKSLSAIRALGKAGFSVHVLGDSLLTVGFWSHYASRRVVVPDAKDDAAAFKAALVEYLKQLQAESPMVRLKPDTTSEADRRPVLLPMEDETLRVVVDNAEALSPLVNMIVPSAAALDVCADKAQTMALALRLGVPHPRTEAACSAEALISAIARLSHGEFVVKPVKGSGSRGVRYNPRFSAAEAEAYLARTGPVVVQERIPPEGDAIGVSVLFDRQGQCVAHFCHKRLQQFPNTGGPSTDRVGILDDALVDLSVRLLTAIQWKGIAMVEWKVDPRTGTPKLLEINPRFWGSLELAIRSGVDFPVIYAHAAAGRVEAPPTPIAGVRCRWLIPGDTLRWLSARGQARESLREFLRGLPKSAEEWDGRDLPGLASSIVCQAFAVLRPKYRKMLER